MPLTWSALQNHVHKRGLNKTTLSAERILEVKEAFVSALRRGGATLAVSPADGHAHLQKYTWLERLDAEGALLFVDRFAETAARWKTLLADYRPDAPGAASAAPASPAAPAAPGAFLPV